MTGYESLMLLCAVVTATVAVASFVLEIIRALAKKDTESDRIKRKPTLNDDFV